MKKDYKMTDLDKKKIVKDTLDKKSLAKSQLPSKIYKFVSFNNDDELNNKKIDTFSNNQVFLSSPLDFNDPYDCQLNMMIIDSLDDFLKLGMNRDQRKKSMKNKKLKLYIQNESQSLQCAIVQNWNEFRSQMLVCCFTESWDDFLMWSHYANIYNGICVEYDMQDLLHCKKNLLPVLYTGSLIATKDYLTPQDFQKEEPKILCKAGIYEVLSKHLSWSYENEWRLIEIEDSITKGKHCVLPTPTAVYFGHRIKDDVKRMLIKQAKQLKIPSLYDVKISNTEYKLIKQEVKTV